MHILFVAENCTSCFAAAGDEGAQWTDCCSMAVDAAAVAGGRRVDSAEESHPIAQVVVERVLDD